MTTAHVLSIGEALGVMRTSQPGTLAHASQLVVDVGGAELNVAIGLSRLGVDSTWVGRVGLDPFGSRILRELAAERVTVRASIDPIASTGLILKESPEQRRTAVSYYRSHSAGSNLSPTDLDGIDFESYSLLHLTGITPALSETARETVLSALERAKSSGLPVSFDVNYRSRLWSADAASIAIAEIIPYVDLLFTGIDEAGVIGASEGDPHQTAKHVADLGVSEVVIKLGDRGAVSFADDQYFEVQAFPVVVEDTVGAGDAFVAGYLYERLRGAAPQDRLATAARAGAAACRSASDWQGAMTIGELRDDTSFNSDPVRR